MKLNEFREMIGIDVETAALQLRVSKACLRYWESGVKVPRPENMTAIFEWSLGNVTPNDFYKLPALTGFHRRAAGYPHGSDCSPGRAASARHVNGYRQELPGQLSILDLAEVSS